MCDSRTKNTASDVRVGVAMRVAVGGVVVRGVVVELERGTRIMDVRVPADL